MDKFNANNLIRCGNELKAANMKSAYELAAKENELAAAKSRCDEVEAEREREKAAWEETVEALKREIGDLQLNLRVKEAECEGRRDRDDRVEAERNSETSRPAAAVVATPSPTTELPSGGEPTTAAIGEPAALTAVASSSSLNSTQSAPVLCTPKKSTQATPFANSPSIKRRSVVSTSMNANYKKPKVTEADGFDGQVGAFVPEGSKRRNYGLF